MSEKSSNLRVKPLVLAMATVLSSFSYAYQQGGNEIAKVSVGESVSKIDSITTTSKKTERKR